MRDSKTGDPIAGVQVFLAGTFHGTLTDDAGQYSIEVNDEALVGASVTLRGSTKGRPIMRCGRQPFRENHEKQRRQMKMKTLLHRTVTHEYRRLVKKLGIPSLCAQVIGAHLAALTSASASMDSANSVSKVATLSRPPT